MCSSLFHPWKEVMQMVALRSISTHVAMDVADLEETTKYLEEILGLPKLREATVEGVGRMVFYPGLELTQAAPRTPAGVVKHVGWEVEDIQATMIELKRRGVTFEPDPPGEAAFEADRLLVLWTNFTTPVGLAGELIQIKKLEG
jgi:catechol 2,3-dioxygenase-like lactoylglutathione lyase family enzyme